MADLATLQARLAEAEAALHAVSIGGQAVRITVDGHTTEYTPAKVETMRLYIGDLKRQIEAASGLPRRPIYLSW